MMRLLEAVLLLAGMIIGAGMFGIPFAFAASGFWFGTLELVFLSAIVLILHLLYAEVVLRTESAHRLPGYVFLYLNKGWGLLERIVAFFGITGTLLVYILLGSLFLSNIFGAVFGESTELLWAITMVAAAAVIVAFPLKKEARVNGILAAALILFLLFMISLLLPHVKIQNFSGFNVKNIFFPYGILLFALSGTVAIPNLVILLNKRRASVYGAVVAGSLLPALLYFLFAFGVVGVSGAGVSSEALRGLRGVVDNRIILLGSVVGFLAVFNAYIILSSNFQSLLRLDLKFSGRLSWLIASFLAFLFYLFGFQSFIALVSLVGGVAGGIEYGLIVAVHHALSRRHHAQFSFLSYFWKSLFFLLLGGGICYEFYIFLN